MGAGGMEVLLIKSEVGGDLEDVLEVVVVNLDLLLGVLKTGTWLRKYRYIFHLGLIRLRMVGGLGLLEVSMVLEGTVASTALWMKDSVWEIIEFLYRNGDNAVEEEGNVIGSD